MSEIRSSLGTWKPLNEVKDAPDKVDGSSGEVWVNSKTLRIIYADKNGVLILGKYTKQSDEINVLDRYVSSEDQTEVDAINKMQIYMCHDNGMTKPTDLFKPT